MTREQWLVNAAEKTWPILQATGQMDNVPPVRYSCGWPSKGALSKRSRALGQCWTNDCSEDGHYEIFISPVLDGAIEVLSVLIHEQIHAAVGIECGHRGPFRRMALAAGLEGRMTSTEAGEELRGKLEAIATLIGPYPHAKLDALMGDRKKQTTRLLKAECPACEYTIRVTRKWADVGLPTCPCGEQMELEDGGEE